MCQQEPWISYELPRYRTHWSNLVSDILKLAEMFIIKKLSTLCIDDRPDPHRLEFWRKNIFKKLITFFLSSPTNVMFSQVFHPFHHLYLNVIHHLKTDIFLIQSDDFYIPESIQRSIIYNVTFSLRPWGSVNHFLPYDMYNCRIWSPFSPQRETQWRGREPD